MSDEDLFAEEMSGVKPLGREARVRLVKQRLSEDQQRGAAGQQKGKRRSSTRSLTRVYRRLTLGM